MNLVRGSNELQGYTPHLGESGGKIKREDKHVRKRYLSQGMIRGVGKPIQVLSDSVSPFNLIAN